MAVATAVAAAGAALAQLEAYAKQKASSKASKFILFAKGAVKEWHEANVTKLKCGQSIAARVKTLQEAH